jgi:glutaconate CoA-transferase subunit A
MSENVITTMEEAVARVEDGMTIGFGGLQGNHPTATMRALARTGRSGLRLVGCPSGMTADLLFATGAVEWLASPHWGVDSLVTVGPAFRARAERGEVEIWECDEGILLAGLRAAGHRLPFLPWQGGVGTDLPTLNPALTEFVDEPSGRTLLRVPALEIDVVFLRALEADVHGNVRYFRHSAYADVAMAHAAREVVVEVERIVPHSVVAREPEATVLHRVDAVVVAERGSHPFRAPGVMVQDDEWIASWNRDLRQTVADGGDPGRAAVVERELALADHDAYLDLVGRERIAGLREA